MAEVYEEKSMQDLSINVRALQAEPFMFEPMPQEYDNANESSSSDPQSEIEDTNIERIGNTLWCQCNHCSAMPTGRENICCREILKVRKKADVQGVHCITEDEDFRTVCLNTAVVETAIYQFIEEEEFLDDTPTFELFRYLSYRQFVRWHKLGKHRREILPACVVTSIRQKFPSDTYTGFKYPKNDY